MAVSGKGAIAKLPPPMPSFPQPNGCLPRLPNTASPAEVAEVVKKHGCVVVEDLAPPETMEALTAELAEAGWLFAGEEGSFAGYDTFRNAAKVLGMSKALQEIAVNPTILGVARQIMGPFCKKIKLGTCSRITKKPDRTVQGRPAPRQTLHRDDMMWAASDWPYPDNFQPTFSVECMWAATDFTKENGATNVVPGSHLWPRGPDGKRPAEGRRGGGLPKDVEVYPAEMKKGSVLVYLGGTLHGAGEHCGKDSAGIRDGLAIFYNLGWLNNEHNWHFAIPKEVQANFSEELKDLLGFASDGTNVTGDPWVTGPLYSLPYQGEPGHGAGQISKKMSEEESGMRGYGSKQGASKL